MCDSKVCWAYQYDKEYFRCTTYTDTGVMDGKFTATDYCYIKEDPEVDPNANKPIDNQVTAE